VKSKGVAAALSTVLLATKEDIVVTRCLRRRVVVVIVGREKRRWKGKTNNSPGLYTTDSIRYQKGGDKDSSSI
jgi:hypothetical protein